MPYTKEEAENIKANLKKIQEYVKEHYVPRLSQNDSLSVAFGELKRYPDQCDMEYEHSFGFSSSGSIWYRSGGLVLDFIEDHDGASRSVYKSWSYAPDLLLQWQQVKRLIEQEFDKRDRERAALAAFEV